MADLVINAGQSIPDNIEFKYRDMLDGTHALIIELRNTSSGGNDIVLGIGSSLPLLTKFRYAQQPDKTYALVKAV